MWWDRSVAIEATVGPTGRNTYKTNKFNNLASQFTRGFDGFPAAFCMESGSLLGTPASATGAFSALAREAAASTESARRQISCTCRTLPPAATTAHVAARACSKRPVLRRHHA